MVSIFFHSNFINLISFNCAQVEFIPNRSVHVNVYSKGRVYSKICAFKKVEFLNNSRIVIFYFNPEQNVTIKSPGLFKTLVILIRT